ncbi:MAG: HD domain-containing protein [Candidatus Polarisedimenticolia bacterium]
MTRDEAWAIVTEWTAGEALRKHALAVETTMQALARRFGGDEDLWGVAGLLHDADYESFPERHPQATVERLRAAGEDELADAVAAHYTKWGRPYEALLPKALVAADELTGFIVACSLVNPEGIAGVAVASVLKKLKQKGFAAKVDRDEVRAGAELLGVELAEAASIAIDALRENKEALGLK